MPALRLKWGRRSFVLLCGTFAVLAIVALRFREPRIEISDARISHQGNRLFWKQDPFTGFVIERYPSSEIYREAHYENGLREGSTFEYGMGGRKKAKWNFHLDQKDGLQEGWYLEGPKRFEFHFRNGVLDGRQIEWHLSGGVFRTQDLENGVETDKKILFPTGEVYSNYSIRDFRIYGVDGGPLCFEPKREGQTL